MAKKDDRKKQKKRKKEALKAKKRTARDLFPRIEVVFDGEDEAFMQAVEKVVHEFDYANTEHCPETIRDAHRLLRDFGIDVLDRVIGSEDFGEFAGLRGMDAAELSRFKQHALYIHLADWIYARLPEQYRQSPLPHFYFAINPVGRGFVLSFEFLPQADIGTQRVWHSPFEPTVNIDNREYKVVFTRHVFERACQRMSLAQPISYLDARGITWHFMRCVHFEPVKLENGQNAMRMFGLCLGTIGQLYMNDVAQLKKADMVEGEWAFVVGYCPVELVEPGFAVGLTILFPGYNNTPEAALVKQTRMHPTLFRELQAAAHDNSLGEVYMTKNMKPLRWYHHNGVPQILRLGKPLYRFS